MPGTLYFYNGQGVQSEAHIPAFKTLENLSFVHQWVREGTAFQYGSEESSEFLELGPYLEASGGQKNVFTVANRPDALFFTAKCSPTSPNYARVSAEALNKFNQFKPEDYLGHFTFKAGGASIDSKAEEVVVGYLAKKYQGDDLFTWIAGGSTFTLPERLRVLIGIAEKIKQLHDKRVLHRDIKLDNIILYIDNRNHFEIHLIDFDDAVFLGDNLYDRDVQRGTKLYMAPEINLKNPHTLRKFSYASDIFAFGVLALLLLATDAMSGLNNSIADGKTVTHGSEQWNNAINQALDDQIASAFSAVGVDYDDYQEVLLLLADMVSSKPVERPTIDEVLATLNTALATISGEITAPIVQSPTVSEAQAATPATQDYDAAGTPEAATPEEWVSSSAAPRDFRSVDSQPLLPAAAQHPVIHARDLAGSERSESPTITTHNPLFPMGWCRPGTSSSSTSPTSVDSTELSSPALSAAVAAIARQSGNDYNVVHLLRPEPPFAPPPMLQWTHTVSESKLDEAHEPAADAADSQSMRRPSGEVQRSIMKIEKRYQSLTDGEPYRNPWITPPLRAQSEPTCSVA